ncbi:MAG: bifunctional phosphopantothenoylcysteine decarboxylase/phosphopantothenate--cysteine ligase CoaBC, partial [Kangiellaceae bacterium]
MNNKKDNIKPFTQPNSQVKTNLLLGVCGGIAAYKSADLVRRLREFGFDVRVVMTESAQEFITPMTMQVVSGYPVHANLFDCEAEAAMGHIELAKWADIVLIAPATANCIAKLAHGLADDLLTTIVLATKAQLVIAPAMNQQMWANQVVKENVQLIKARAVHVLEPDSGEQACGDIGAGRMQEPLQIAQSIYQKYIANHVVNKISAHSSEFDLSNKKIVITAGPTQEAIDPVRYISNHSSGKMGYALAEAAVERGAQVVLVAGPVSLTFNQDAKLVKVNSAEEMLSAVKDNLTECDVFIGCAAIADYRPVDIAPQKIKKNNAQMQLTLIKNPDILKWVSDNKPEIFVVGFAAESEKLKEFAKGKLKNKNLDMICANDISLPDLGFNSENNSVLLLNKNGKETLLPTMPKKEIAIKILAQITDEITVKDN